MRGSRRRILSSHAAAHPRLHESVPCVQTRLARDSPSRTARSVPVDEDRIDVGAMTEHARVTGPHGDGVKGVTMRRQAPSRDGVPWRTWSVMAVLLLSLGAPTAARGEENIYARDLATAKRGVLQAQDRLERAAADAESASRRLPALRERTNRWRAIADRRQRLSYRADARAA